jgi:ribosomal protein S18 acetylase RimI-like enzyme
MTIDSAMNISASLPGHLRPLNPLRDLGAIADLIELCFHSTMDSDGKRYLQDMRRSANDSAYLRWAAKAADTISLPLSGFVWEDEGHIVGNVSVITYHRHGTRYYLIANVATHPEYRRRGIGRMLTKEALQHSREKKADEIWLQVREDNPGAIALYEELGFREQYRRTTWHTSPSAPITPPSKAISVNPRRPTDWVQQSTWLERAHPSGASWYYSNFWNNLQPGLWNSFTNFMADINIDQWTGWDNGRLSATLSVLYGRGNTDMLWMAAPPVGSAPAVHTLLVRARNSVDSRRGLMFEYPAHEYEEAIHAAGFVIQRTLLWMKAA